MQVVARPCPGLARLIEDGDLDAPALRDSIALHTAALREAGVDTVVLGCTHYAFVHPQIQQAMGPDVCIIDTAEAVARHAAHRLQGLVQPVDAPARLLTTGDPQRLRRIADAWLPFACHVEGLSPDDPLQ